MELSAEIRRERQNGAPAPPLPVQQAQAGDRAALRTLFDQFHRSIMSYCLISANGDRDRAMDLAQETFARAFRHLDKLQDPERFRGWLFTIASNVCRSSGARENKRREVLASLALEIEPEPSIEEEAVRKERIAIVGRFLEGIQDPVLQQIVQLKYTGHGCTTREIAEQLDIPHGTVTVKLMRFRAAVKGDLARILLDGQGGES